MTALRPEHDADRVASYEQGAYEAAGAFEAAVDQLADPLNDPLPGQEGSPWFRSATVRAQSEAPQAQAQPQEPVQQPQEWYDPEGYQQQWYGRQAPVQEPQTPVQQQPVQRPSVQQTAQQPVETPEPIPVPAYEPVPEPAAPVSDDETVGLRTADTRRIAEQKAPPPPTGGRAERRRAAKGRGTKEPKGKPDRPDSPAKADEAVAPLSRMEARRAARAAKDSPAVIASRVVGELFISLGVLMLLFVTYQLWWTNVRADLFAGKETDKIQDGWAKGERKPGAFEPGQGFAILHIPKLDVVVPIAEGIDKPKVLDNGMVGHYAEGKLKTAMPSDKQGNFAVAGHRNTHGEPFRYINRLERGDAIIVETQDRYYTYEMASILPQTSPSNVGVIGPVPPGSGFTKPGRYITLTTCTPEFTSTYRMIVWGKMVDERPRSKGLPDALVG